MENRLIVIDGLDGSGKTTQQELLVDFFKNKDIGVKGISFPDYESESSSLIKMYLNGEFGSSPSDVNAYAASSFYAVDRFASYKKHWEKEFKDGDFIIAARYTSSNLFHQMGKLSEEHWDEFIEWAADYEYKKLGIPQPALVIFLDMPLSISKNLISKRYEGDETKRDIHEKDFDYLKRCRESALFASNKLGYKIIDCSNGKEPLSIEEVQEKIINLIKEDFSLGDRI